MKHPFFAFSTGVGSGGSGWAENQPGEGGAHPETWSRAFHSSGPRLPEGYLRSGDSVLPREGHLLRTLWDIQTHENHEHPTPAGSHAWAVFLVGLVGPAHVHPVKVQVLSEHVSGEEPADQNGVHRAPSRGEVVKWLPKHL